MELISPPNCEDCEFMLSWEHFCPGNVKAGDLSDVNLFLHLWHAFWEDVFPLFELLETWSGCASALCSNSLSCICLYPSPFIDPNEIIRSFFSYNVKSDGLKEIHFETNKHFTNLNNSIWKLIYAVIFSKFFKIIFLYLTLMPLGIDWSIPNHLSGSFCFHIIQI